MHNAPLDELRAYAESLADSVPSMTTTRAVNAALHGKESAVSVLRRRLATSGFVVVTFLSGNVGLAWAADSAVPDDALYGLDRAYETIASTMGIGGDHTGERLEEATELIERGAIAKGLSTAREGVEGISGNLEAPGIAEALEGLDLALAATSPPGAVDAFRIVEAAKLVRLAAQSGDHAALQAAAHQIKIIAVAHAKEAGYSSDTAPGQTGDTPSVTAPGQTGDTPSVTAPGQTGDTPNVTAPGQTGDTPNVTAPGQAKDKDE